MIRNKLLRLRGAALWLERRRRWARSVGLPRNKFLVPLLKLSTETSMLFAKSSEPFSKRLCQIASTSPPLAPPQSFNHLTTRFPDFQGLGSHIYKAVAILPLLLLQPCNSYSGKLEMDFACWIQLLNREPGEDWGENFPSTEGAPFLRFICAFLIHGGFHSSWVFSCAKSGAWPYVMNGEIAKQRRRIVFCCKNLSV